MRRILRCFYGLCLLGLLSLLCGFFRTDLRRNYVQPSIEALFLHNTDIFVEEYTLESPTYSCPSNVSDNAVEDVLCMEPKTFLKNFKNPCWYEHPNKSRNNSSMNHIRNLRCLPYFHIFGVCKTGTTDLFYRLIQHPQILPNAGVLGKETWFWSWRRYGDYSYEGRKVKLDQFVKAFNAFKIGETKVSIEDWSQYSDLITGHGDPMDFWDHQHWRKIHQNDPSANIPTFMTPHLVKHTQPNIKLILLLREPAERLYSHYYHGRYGLTAEQFHHDVIAGIQQLNDCVDRHSYRTCLYKYNMTTSLPLPLSASLYYLHLQEWLDVFPKEQIFVFRNEDYKKDKKYSLFKLFEFLDVGDISTRLVETIVNLPHAYETKRKATEGSMLNETWEILAEFFEEPNRKLAVLLNDDRYLWKDAKYRYRPKVTAETNKTISKTDQLRRYYERKKKSKLHPHSDIDQRIKLSKNFDEWLKTIQEQQKQRVKSQNLTLKKAMVPYRQKKLESGDKPMTKYNLVDKSPRGVNTTFPHVRRKQRKAKVMANKAEKPVHVLHKRSIDRVLKQQYPMYNLT